ncbi:Hsp20/alpha crystallin family protein [Melioribacteraceae bacterium 4301-Me]|uniref:Hsp20/alpha crystallin family protein n=1 Tax=Pyranulibacter aquaticus TaxID=3163344 RepID=UPI00359B5550
MKLVRWNPMRDLVEIEREFDRLFRNFDSRFGFNIAGNGNEDLENAVWAPLSDIYEDNDNFVVRLDLPGVKKEDVKISYDDGQLIITGERKQEKETENHKFHRVERIYGKFYRSFVLPNKIKEGKISAEFKDGQLTITIPKAEEAKPKEIPIKVS